MRRVGLTGNIASGKSTVAGLLRDLHGIPVIDADQVAREVVSPGSPLLGRITARFGPGVLAADGSLDREAMGTVIRGDPEARQALEALTHPAIYDRIDLWLEEQTRQGAAVAVIEASLLVETGQERRYDMLVVVSCHPATQIRRLVRERGMSPEAAQAWLGTQLPAAHKEARADLVIHNDGDRAALERAVTAALPRIRGARP